MLYQQRMESPDLTKMQREVAELRAESARLQAAISETKALAKRNRAAERSSLVPSLEDLAALPPHVEPKP